MAGLFIPSPAAIFRNELDAGLFESGYQGCACFRATANRFVRVNCLQATDCGFRNRRGGTNDADAGSAAGTALGYG